MGNIGIPKQERSGLKEKSKLEITNETCRSSFLFRVTYGQELQKEVIEIQAQDSVRTEYSENLRLRIMPMEIFRRDEREMMELEQNSEKHQQNRGKIRANKEDTEQAIKDMTPEKQNCKNKGRKWRFWKRMINVTQTINSIKQE